MITPSFPTTNNLDSKSMNTCVSWLVFSPRSQAASHSPKMNSQNQFRLHTTQNQPQQHFLCEASPIPLVAQWTSKHSHFQIRCTSLHLDHSYSQPLGAILPNTSNGFWGLRNWHRSKAKASIPATPYLHIPKHIESTTVKYLALNYSSNNWFDFDSKTREI